MAKYKRKITSRGYRAFRVCNVIIMILLMVAILVPILSVVVNSFVSAAEIARRGDQRRCIARKPQAFDGSGIFVLLARD